MMLNVYCISGMGVDERLFKNLELNNCAMHHISWLVPHKNESLASYAQRLAEKIDIAQPYGLIGVSFGGMCCIEIAKILKPQKVFIISSCKTQVELPLKARFWKYFPLYKILNDGILISGAMLLKKQFGVIGKETGMLFNEMLKGAPSDYYSNAIHCIVTWKNDIVPDSVIHIHGTADRLLPLRRNSHYNYVIEGGTHFMIMDRAKEISRIINKELE